MYMHTNANWFAVFIIIEISNLSFSKQTNFDFIASLSFNKVWSRDKSQSYAEAIYMIKIFLKTSRQRHIKEKGEENQNL